MRNRENLVIMDDPAGANGTRNRQGIYLSRGSLVLITAIVLCCLCGAGFLVYHFLSCHSKLLTPVCDSSMCDPLHSNSDGSAHGGTRPNGEDELQNETEVIDVMLPRSVIPLAYDLKFTPFLDADNFTFNGVASIRIRAMEACRNVTLHENGLKIDKSSVRVLDVASQRSIGVLQQFRIEAKQFYVIELEDELKKGDTYEVHIDFVGILNDDLQGFYRSSYNLGDDTVR